MRRFLIILITYHLSLIASQAQALSERYNAKHPVVMVCDWDKPPYEFLNDRGEPAGSNIDAMRAVMKELGIPIQFVMKEWSIALKTFERGDADLIIANSRRYRKEPYYVTENIINFNRIRVATHSDSTDMITFKQLEREGAVFKPGDYSAFYFMDGDSVNTEFMEFQTPKVALMGVLHGDYKYYVWGEEPLKWKIKELNLEGIVLNDVGIPISEVHVVGRDRQLIEQIDDHYSRLKQRGEIAIIQDKWFHPERIEEEFNYAWLYAIICALALAVILYLFNRLASRHVKVASRSSTELNEMMEQNIIQIAPLAFMRGRTLNDAVVILDEAQNTTPAQIKMFLTRMGMNTKMIITGDVTQIDLPRQQRSGLIDALEVLREVQGIEVIHLNQKDIVRHKLVTRIVEAYEKSPHPPTPSPKGEG